MFEKPNSDYILASAPFFQYVVLMFQDLMISAGMIVPGEFRSISIGLASFPMILALIVILRERPRTLIVTYAVILYIVLCTFIFFPQNEEYLLNEMFYLLCINIPCFLCILAINDYTILKKVMLYISYPITLLGVLYFVFLIGGTITLDQYDMAFGYYLLFPAVVYLNQGKLIFTFLFIITCILILLVGSRGALLAALLYSFFLLLLDRKGRTRMLLFAFIIVVACGIVFAINPGLLNLSDMSYRTLNMIREGGLADDSNRLGIWSLVWEKILDNPVWGHGIYGDRVILVDYSHNFFLELLYNFGLYAGSILILILLSLLIRALIISDTDGRKLLMMFFCYCFIPLMYSKSYLNDPGFGLFLGCIVALPKAYKTVKYKYISA
jgi:O-antigen ligase